MPSHCLYLCPPVPHRIAMGFRVGCAWFIGLFFGHVESRDSVKDSSDWAKAWGAWRRGLASGRAWRRGLAFGLGNGCKDTALHGGRVNFSPAKSSGLVSGLDDGRVDFSLGMSSGLVFGLDSGLVFGLDTGLVFGLDTRLVFGLDTGLAFGLDTGLVFGLDTRRCGERVDFSLAKRVAFNLSRFCPIRGCT